MDYGKGIAGMRSHHGAYQLRVQQEDLLCPYLIGCLPNMCGPSGLWKVSNVYTEVAQSCRFSFFEFRAPVPKQRLCRSWASSTCRMVSAAS